MKSEDLSPHFNRIKTAEEIFSVAELSNSRMIEEMRTAQRHKELTKQNRILASKIDPYVHAIETIIEWMERVKDPNNKLGNAGDKKSCSIDYSHFNFEDRMDVVNYIFEPFFDKLKKARCFSKWSKPQMNVRRNYYKFENVNVGKLKKYKNMLTTKNQEESVPNDDLDDKNFFGFQEKTFWLKIIAGQNFTINFNPKKRETTNPFCLMQALVAYIRGHGQVINGYLTTIVPRQEIINYLSKNYPNLKPSQSPWETWIRFTRNNLNLKINDGSLVIIKNIDKQEQGYPFFIKIPPSTPQLHNV